MTGGNTAGKERVQLGAVQQTLFGPLAARARETRRKRPLLRDPKAAELIASIDFDTAKFDFGSASWMMVLRTAIYDFWVRQFLAGHPAGTVIELGTGLNTRFDRVDNGQVHWIDLDLPDTIELRGRFFTDTSRRRMVPASLVSEEWLPAVADSPGPYFFVTEGVLAYLPEREVTQTLARIAARFPGARLALDTYPRRMMQQQHKLAERRGFAPWQWPCDDPGSLQRLGLRLDESATVTRPPRAMRRELPPAYRYLLLPLADPLMGKMFATLSLFTVTGPAQP
ncbi:MAG TPA: class I SAM-dependent methyltransferase [Streptosporangiaceae bacterium]